MRARQTFPLARLQELSDKHAFSAHNRAIEDARCANDLLYALFRRPETVLLPRLLPGLLELIAKKNAPDMERSRRIREGREFLLDAARHPNHRIRIYAVLLIVNREPEAHAVFRDGYADGNYFGSAKEGRAQFERFLPHLAQLFDALFAAPYGEANSVQRITELVGGSELFYLSK